MWRYLPKLVFLLPALAGSTDLKACIARLEARYRAAKTLEASFIERYTENGRLIRVEAGIAYFRRPGKMRWEYEAPEKNLFLVDGKTAWFYVPADHTATRVPAKASADWRTPLALLLGEIKIARVCDKVRFAIHEKPESPDNAVLSCQLRGEGVKSHEPSPSENTMLDGDARESMLLEIVKKTGELVRVVVRDSGGVGIEFHFTNWQADPKIDDALFRFIAPPGVAIVNGELPESGARLSP